MAARSPCTARRGRAAPSRFGSRVAPDAAAALDSDRLAQAQAWPRGPGRAPGGLLTRLTGLLATFTRTRYCLQLDRARTRLSIRTMRLRSPSIPAGTGL